MGQAILLPSLVHIKGPLEFSIEVFPGLLTGFVDLPNRANNPLASLHHSVPNYSKLRVIPHAKYEVGMSAGREGEPVVRSLFACSKLSLDIPGLQVCRVI